MQIPDFSDFLKVLDLKQVDELAAPMVPDGENVIVFPDGSVKDLAKAVEVADHRVQAISRARSLVLLNLYHVWLKEQLDND